MRILPVTIAMASLVLIVKCIDLITGTQTLSEHLLAARLEAKQPDPHYSTTALAALRPAAGEEDEEGEGEGAEEGADTEAGDEGNDATAAGDGEGDQAAETAEEEMEEEKPHEYSQVELDILQSLSARRMELEAWADQVQLRESMLEASELKLARKVEEMKRLQQQIQALLAEYNEKEDMKIRSLVKIYESMKPKDAARIFEEIDMPVLLQVVDKMKEKKAAPILGKMDPKRAKEITEQLAEQRKLRRQQQKQAGIPMQP